ncbi:hypothetical protein GGR52DRAFT_490099 [Hypoxylon sp. FL1284]|nr:hypothetical protein GGR52DRAFT_490099 [Hypoxylon sp. FL1284]
MYSSTRSYICPHYLYRRHLLRHLYPRYHLYLAVISIPMLRTCTNFRQRPAYAVCLDAEPDEGAGSPVAVRLGTRIEIPCCHDMPTCSVWEAVRATSAAPTYFDPQEITVNPGIKKRFLDGALYYNNPIHTLREVIEPLDLGIWDQNIGYISIGTGMPSDEERELARNSWRTTTNWIVSRAVKTLGSLPNTPISTLRRFLEGHPGLDLEDILDCTMAYNAHVSFERMSSNGQPKKYFRFDCDATLRGDAYRLRMTRIDAYQEMNDISQVTRKYLEDVSVSALIRECAAGLLLTESSKEQGEESKRRGKKREQGEKEEEGDEQEETKKRAKQKMNNFSAKSVLPSYPSSVREAIS